MNNEDFGTDYFISMLRYGKENGLNAPSLHVKYKLDGGLLQLAIFRRFLRLHASDARRRGIKIVGDSSGYYIAKNEAEWQEYTKTQLNSAFSKMKSIAMCEGKTVSQIIRRKLGGKKEVVADQLSFFEG